MGKRVRVKGFIRDGHRVKGYLRKKPRHHRK